MFVMNFDIFYLPVSHLENKIKKVIQNYMFTCLCYKGTKSVSCLKKKKYRMRISENKILNRKTKRK